MVIIVRSEANEDTIRGRLGTPDYSYYFVLREFLPVLDRLGTVLTVGDSETEWDSLGEVTAVYEPAAVIDAIFALCRRVGEPCVFLSFAPPHRTILSLQCPTVPVFAWEFQDLPCETWEGDERHDWRFVLKQLPVAVTHSTFAERVVRSALGELYDVQAIPAPVWDRFAPLREPENSPPDLSSARLTLRTTATDSRTLNLSGRPPDGAAEPLAGSTAFAFDPDASAPSDRQPAHAALVLDGVVYTAIFNPADGRKQWRDMIRCFCIALSRHSDATLVLKLTHGGWSRTRMAMIRELVQSSPFECRVVLLEGFLNDVEYAALLRRSTYALSVSSGEGQCLPLMEYMSAGKPAVAARHTGMQDYVDEDNAFPVETSLEPCAWPQDPRPRYRTFRHRINAESLMQAFRESYRVAKKDPERYARMSSHAVAALREHCSQAVVETRLRAVLERAAAAGAPSRGDRQPRPHGRDVD